MSRRHILTTFLLLVLASSAWGAISITSSAPPSPITIGQGYSFQISASSGANFAVTAGSLPTGMTMSSGGLLSATQVTATGTFNFTVTATSTSNTSDTATAPYSIVVNNGSPTVNRSSFNSKAAVGTAYSSQLTGLGGNPSPSYSWSLAPGNNDGISLSATGLLSGTPISSGIVPLNVQISDGVAFGSVVLQLNVIGIDTTTLPNGSVGTAYSQQLAASGAVGSITWAISGSSGLPPGLTLSSNGVISGTPTTNGSYPFAISATDSTGNIATANFTITIGATFTITSTTLPNATVGVAYSQALTASGGTSPLTWSATGLPSTLTLSTTGVLSGTPTAAGSVPFTVTVKDANNQTATANLTLTVVAAQFRITTTSPLPNGTVSAPYSQTMQATGGTAPLNWSAGGLPTGLSIDAATGVISGTPTSAGSTTFTVSVTDSTNALATGSFVITISQPTLTITDVTASCFVGAAYVNRRFPDAERTIPPGCPASYQYTTTTGTAPYTWSATGLPAGVTMNASTGSLSGVFPSVGTVNFTVILTDATQQRGVLNSSINVLALPTIASNDIILGGTPAPNNIGAALQQAVVVSIPGGVIPFQVRGTITLSFVSSVGGDDQLVRFSNGTRSAGFTISPTSGGRASFNDGSLSVLTGTVAGTITLSASFSDNSTPSNDMTPRPVKTFVYTVVAGTPVITRVVISNASPTGFTVAVTGYSTPRDMTSAQFNFTPTTGTTLAAGSATVQLGAAFTQWYGTTASNAFGSQFTFTIPFTVSSTGAISGAPISAITVSLTNSKGTSSTFGPVNP